MLKNEQFETRPFEEVYPGHRLWHHPLSTRDAKVWKHQLVSAKKFGKPKGSEWKVGEGPVLNDSRTLGRIKRYWEGEKDIVHPVSLSAKFWPGAGVVESPMGESGKVVVGASWLDGLGGGGWIRPVEKWGGGERSVSRIDGVYGSADGPSKVGEFDDILRKRPVIRGGTSWGKGGSGGGGRGGGSIMGTEAWLTSPERKTIIENRLYQMDRRLVAYDFLPAKLASNGVMKKQARTWKQPVPKIKPAWDGRVFLEISSERSKFRNLEDIAGGMNPGPLPEPGKF